MPLFDFGEFRERMNRKEFIAKDNPLREPLFVSGPNGSRWIFWNGATSDGRHGHTYPPDDELELTALRAEYLTARLEQLKKQYRNIHTAVSEQAELAASDNAGGVQLAACVRTSTPDQVMPGWKEELERLAKQIETTKSELRALLGNVKDTRREAAADSANYRSEQRNSARNAQRALADMPTY